MSTLMEFTALRDWLLTGAVGIIVMSFLKEVHELRKSVESLNVNIGVLIEKAESHERRLITLEEHRRAHTH